MKRCAACVLVLALAGCGGGKKSGATVPTRPAPAPTKGAVPWPAPKNPMALTRKAGLTPETHEFVFLNHTPMGDVLCVYFEGDDPVESNRRLAASRSDYDVWFKERCKEIFPPEIDVNQPLPPITQIFDSQEILVAR